MKLLSKVVLPALIVAASGVATLEVLANKDAQARVDLLQTLRADSRYPQNQRGDILSNAGLPEVQSWQLRERKTLEYMLKDWYPKITAGELVHNTSYQFKDFVEPAADKTQMVVKMKVCIEPDKAPEMVYLNKVYAQGSISKQDIVNIQTFSDYPFPSSHAGLEGAQYFYGHPGSGKNAYLELKSDQKVFNMMDRVALTISDEDQAAAAPLCPRLQDYAEPAKKLETELLQYVLGAQMRSKQGGEYGEYLGVKVKEVELDQTSLGIAFEVDGRQGAQKAYQVLAKAFAGRGIQVTGNTQAMLSAEGQMLWDTFFSGYALDSNKALMLNGGLDPLTEVYELHLVLQVQ